MRQTAVQGKKAQILAVTQVQQSAPCAERRIAKCFVNPRHASVLLDRARANLLSEICMIHSGYKGELQMWCRIMSPMCNRKAEPWDVIFSKCNRAEKK